MLAINLFSGPNFRLGSIRNVPIKLGVLPFFSYVEFLSLSGAESHCNDRLQQDLEEGKSSFGNSQEAFDECIEEFIDNRPVFEEFPLLQKLTVHTVGWIVLFTMVGLMVGFPEALAKVVDTYPQLIQLALDKSFNPVSSFANQHERWFLAQLVGTVAMKTLAISLLPFPGTTGGVIIQELATKVLNRRVRFTFGAIFFFCSGLIGIGVFINRVLTLQGESPLTIFVATGLFIIAVVGQILWNSRDTL